MKVIDLLNKIANGEEVPKKIKFYGKYYIWYDNRYTGNEGYCLEPLKSDSNSFLEINTVYDLNNEVEIIEEEKKIPEKLGYFDLTKDKKEYGENGERLELHYTGVADTLDTIYEKINEIIDYINKE